MFYLQEREYLCIFVPRKQLNQAVKSADIDDHKEHFPARANALFIHPNGCARFKTLPFLFNSIAF